MMWIQPTYLSDIQAQRKTVEPRLGSSAMERIFPGDIIRFECNSDEKGEGFLNHFSRASQPPMPSPANAKRYKLCKTHIIDVKVISMLKYSSFKEMLEYEGVTSCLPETSDINAGVAIYNDMPNYEKLAPKLGVIAFRITTNTHDATPIPRPLLVVRGGRRTHVLTRHEFQILTGSTSGHKHVTQNNSSKCTDVSTTSMCNQQCVPSNTRVKYAMYNMASTGFIPTKCSDGNTVDTNAPNKCSPGTSARQELTKIDGTPAHVLRIQNTYLWHIKEGRKTVEGRLAVGIFKQIIPKAIIRFECGPNHVDARVLQVTKYKSFQAMLENEGLTNCLPDCANIRAGIQIYHSFPNYAKLEQTTGVIALQITIDLSKDDTSSGHNHGRQSSSKTNVVTQRSRSRSRKRDVK